MIKRYSLKVGLMYIYDKIYDIFIHFNIQLSLIIVLSLVIDVI